MKIGIRRSGAACEECGARLGTKAKFCPECGTSVPIEQTDPQSAPPPEANRGHVTRIAIVATLSVLVVGLIVGGALKVRHDQEVKREKSAALAAKKKREAAAAAAQAAYEACEESQGELLGALDDLNARLNVGMNADEYGDAVGDVSVAYQNSTNDVDVDSDCLGNVAVPAEAAVNRHIRAARRWNNCISDLDCNVDDINLQRYWSRASEKAGEASLALAVMEP